MAPAAWRLLLPSVWFAIACKRTVCPYLPASGTVFMSTIAPKGSGLREAIRYVSHQLGQESPEPLIQSIERATLRFDLNPNQAEYLLNFYRSAPKPREGTADED